MSKAKNIVLHVLVFGLIYGFLFSYFKPLYLLSDTITTGGDTASHFPTAHYLIQTLLPAFKIVGWMPGNYAGFPLFQFYFPLPFLIMALFDLVMPLTVAFKLVSVLGVLLLPVCVYGCVRLIGYSQPAPLIGASFSLAFLFMEANSMWGGNIPSTLSGEFCYGIGFSLLFLYFGTFYRGILEDKHPRLNAVLLVFIGLSHGYTLLFAVFVTTFFLFTTDDFFRKAWYYLKVNALAFFMLGFWIVPLLWFMPLNTSYNFVWLIDSLSIVIPLSLLPFVVLAAISPLFVRRDAWRPVAYLWFICGLAAVFYFTAYTIGVVDIRFVPFFQGTLMILGAVSIQRIVQPLKARKLFTVLMTVSTILWVNSHVSAIPNWIDWNYSGFESKHLWRQFQALNQHLKGGPGDPRVVYEHHDRNSALGTLRAFELLPYFSGRSTLEGLYMQSSPTSPFVFYIQSELSEKPSCPLQGYNCSRINVNRALGHLKLFNVSQIIATGDRLRWELHRNPETSLEKEFPPYAVYSLNTNANRYVSLIRTKPVLAIGKHWRDLAFEWFRTGNLDALIAFAEKERPGDNQRFSRIVHDTGRILTDDQSLPPTPLDDPLGTNLIQETVEPEEIIIRTPHIGKPHLIKISYHPNWKAEGADRIYIVSPSFMLVYPEKNTVRLYYSGTFPNRLGQVLTVLGILILILSSCIFQKVASGYFHIASAPFSDRLNGIQTTVKSRISKLTQGITPLMKKRILAAVIAGLTVAIGAAMANIHLKDPQVLFQKGLNQYHQGNYPAARKIFSDAIRAFPRSSVVDKHAYHLSLTFYKEQNWEKALGAFQKAIAEYPDSRRYSEMLFHVGMCYVQLKQEKKAAEIYEQIMARFPKDQWAETAAEKLQELRSAKR